ncbi:glycine betaine ABC transporter substrate-binding protein [Paenibacillus alginolyticus]|uniref:Osmoprotectant ABC transporter substrate-binding protein n=1 Tax=Paenibacillus alginolyticus TaxID=59839 RepID=A0ABT4GDJ0_9BACL|nr:glycine betaine ABC transporter substrate-binding protein [Paenibacillus alginolyticus]MCY9694179.1 osmoprotectant ABC transporter substrate-binding protein [Paenibacillus alginolyticus]MEC0142729.1 glycine betaine ABC transporter substrate-binding protein [Paenibacillus alginolyticus]
MRKGILGLMGLLLSISVLLSGCGSGKTIKIGAQTYTEPKIIAEMYKALVEDRTDLKVEVKPDLSSSPVVIKAMKNKEIDMATLYTGEVFNGYFDVEQTKDRAKVLQQAQTGFDKNYDFKWFDPYGFENTYAFTVRKDLADQFQLEKISDLANEAKSMKIGVDTTWLERDNDGYKAFSKQYGLSFGQTLPMEIGLVYEAVANKKVDIVLAYSTDARIKQFDLKTLQDDKQFFPPYDASAVVRKETLQKYPELNDVVQLLVGKINADSMIELNYEVDVKKRSEKDVAVDFLKKAGLLK